MQKSGLHSSNIMILGIFWQFNLVMKYWSSKNILKYLKKTSMMWPSQNFLLYIGAIIKIKVNEWINN